jgi:hypothetical protein
MRRDSSILAAALAVGSGAVLMSRDAHALGPVDLEVGAKAGVGSNPASTPSGSTVSPSNPLGFGIGARGGVAISGFYGGVNLMYYLGSSQSVAGGSASVHTVMYGVEAGYGLTLIDILTIRPQVGLGNATFSSSVDAPINLSSSKSNLYVEPGVTGIVSLGLLFVGADANLLFFPGLDNSQTAFTVHGQVGVKL